MSKQLQLSFSFETPSALLTPSDIFQLSGAHLLARLKLKEDRRIERKSPGIQPRTLGEYISMWSNTAPDGGLIIVGIEDKTGAFIGCHTLSQDQINEREKASFIFCSEAKTESKRVPVVAADGTDSFLLVFRVFYRDDKVVLNSSHCCPRHGWT